MADSRKWGLASEPWGMRLLSVLTLLLFLGITTLLVFAYLRVPTTLNLVRVVSEGIVVGLVLIRRPYRKISGSPLAWVATGVGAFGALFVAFVRPRGSLLPHDYGPEIAYGILAVGFAIQFVAKLSLGRSFGLVPANRGVQTKWIYRLVRHPMYLGYLLTHVTFALAMFSWISVGIYAGVWLAMVVRILEEEKLLREDEAYREYAGRTRYRLIPWVF